MELKQEIHAFPFLIFQRSLAISFGKPPVGFIKLQTLSMNISSSVLESPSSFHSGQICREIISWKWRFWSEFIFDQLNRPSSPVSDVRVVSSSRCVSATMALGAGGKVLLVDETDLCPSRNKLLVVEEWSGECSLEIKKGKRQQISSMYFYLYRHGPQHSTHRFDHHYLLLESVYYLVFAWYYSVFEEWYFAWYY